MRLLVTGASGFIGKPLVSFFKSRGFSVSTNFSDPGGFDVVVHLAGEPLTLSRWSKKKKRKILFSRSEGTASLCQILSALEKPPQVFISASAVGFYGDRGEESLTEESERGSGFLAHVCSAWENASTSLRSRGVRTVHARFGIVIGPNGGILKKLLLAYKLGLAGPLGAGKQWVSWIHLEDLIQAIYFIIEHPTIEGPVNFVSPNPIRQKDFAKTVADLLHRPSFFPLPAPLLRLVLGSTADQLLLASQKVVCSKLLAAKFAFKYPDLRSAVYNALRF